MNIYRPMGHGAAERVAERPKHRSVVEVDSELYRRNPGKHVLDGWALYDRIESEIFMAKCPSCGQLARVNRQRIRRYNRCADCDVKRGAYADLWHGRKGHGDNSTVDREWHTLNQPMFNAMATGPLREATHEFSRNIYGASECESC